MSVKTTTIHLHLGGLCSSFPLQYFVARNKEALAKLGVFAFSDHLFFDSPLSKDNATLKRPPWQGTLPEISAMKKLINGYEWSEVTICYFHIDLHFSPEFIANTLCPALLDAFPDAHLKFFWPLVREDLELETAYAFFSLQGHCRYGASWFANQLHTFPSYYSCFSYLIKRFPPGSFQIECFDSAEAISVNIIDRFISSLNISHSGLRDAGGDFSLPPFSLGLPNEFIHFCKIHHMLNPKSCEVGSTFEWSTQAQHFARPLHNLSPISSVFSPEDRSKLLRKHAADNIQFANYLKIPTLFPTIEISPDWQPYLGLTNDSAFTVASRLDRDFGDLCLNGLDKIPKDYLTYQQRIARDALHSVLGSRNSLPPVKRQNNNELSVLTLTYNHANFIEQNIKSVIDQQVDFPIQHIIADDASEDGTQEIILKYAAKYTHIIPIFQKKRTYGQNNVAALFDMARTPYVAICDGDDYFCDAHKLQIQYDFMQQHKDCTLCFHPVKVFYEDNSRNEYLYPPLEQLPRGVKDYYYISELIKQNFIQTNSVMYRWRFSNGLPDWFRADLMPGDWYWHLLHAELGKIGFINRVMSKYRKHPAGAYYFSEINRLKHRYMVGARELAAYDAIDRHFQGRFQGHLASLADGVIADTSRYIMQTGGGRSEREKYHEEVAKKYPFFIMHFYQTLERLSKQPD